MINNKDRIKELLRFDDENDFFMLYVMKRKKDQTGDKSKHQSVRIIKSYVVESIEYLEDRWDEIVGLCEYFKARAYIYPQVMNHKDISLDVISHVVDRMKSGQYNQQYLFNSVVGKTKTRNRVWIIDIDEPVISPMLIAHIEYQCEPKTIFSYDVWGNHNGYINPPKIITTIRTKNGWHLLTKPFYLEQFKDTYPNIDVQKQGPTLLYFPDSLENNS